MAPHTLDEKRAEIAQLFVVSRDFLCMAATQEQPIAVLRPEGGADRGNTS